MGVATAVKTETNGAISEAPEPARSPSFIERFCSYFECDEAAYEEKLLSLICDRPTRFVFAFLRAFSPHSLHPEYQLVRQLAHVDNLRDVKHDIEFYQHKYVCNSMLREGLNRRVSGKRLMAIAIELFPEQDSRRYGMRGELARFRRERA